MHKTHIALMAYILVSIACYSPASADLVLQGDIFGFQRDGVCFIRATVLNQGAAAAHNSEAHVEVVDNADGGVILVEDAYLGTIGVGEQKTFEVELPGIGFGDDINTRIKFTWEE